MESATVANVSAFKAMRAQPVSAGSLLQGVKHLTTLCAMAEGPASVISVSVMRDTSVQNAMNASAALTLARPNCKEFYSVCTVKLLFNIWFSMCHYVVLLL